MLIIPAQLHINFEVLFKAGMLPIKTVGAPTIQGATVKGMQGIGVNTPSAAAVAAATMGLAKLLHIPNGKMLSIGLLSIIFAAGIAPPAVMTRFTGSTVSEEGATPNVHCSIAPIQTCCAIIFQLLALGNG